MVPSKEILREKIKEHLNTVSKEEFYSQGEKAAALLRSSPLWPGHKTVYLFLSMKAEINTGPLLEAALKDGKKVYAPCIGADVKSAGLKRKDALVFYPVLSPQGPWKKGPFGIREPLAGINGTEGGETGEFPILVITPGLAFDREGNRLGRGRAYYDRFFAELDAAGRSYTAIGFCMDFQLLEKVPAREYDKKMNGLAAGNELIILS